MRVRIANGADWWLNRLNTLGVLPANVAMLLRSISAKRLGGNAFRPRPVTAANFSDAELAAIDRLSRKQDGTYGPVTFASYDRYISPDVGQGAASGIKVVDPGSAEGQKSIAANKRFEGRKAGDFLSPLGVVSTSLGQFTPQKDGGDVRFRDTYDFNRVGLNTIRNQDGTLTLPGGDEVTKQEFDAVLGKMLHRTDTPYGRLRNNAAVFAHNSGDPDDAKIKVDVSLSDIRKRLPFTSDAYSITRPMSRRGMLLRGAAAGGLTALPVGAALGFGAGLLSLTSRERRKRWLRSLLVPTAVGMATAGLAGAAGGGLLADKIRGRLSKKAEQAAPVPASASVSGQKNRKRRWRDGLVTALTYGVPLSAGVLASVYAGRKLRDAVDRLQRPVDWRNEITSRVVSPDFDIDAAPTYAF